MGRGSIAPEPVTVPVSLHNHGEFSLLRSTLRIAELVRAASSFGMPAVGLTDRNSVAGLTEFAKACQACQPALQPVLGCEVEMERGYPIVLLAMNDHGYGNLSELLTRTSHEFQPISWKKLARLSEGLICLTGGQDAEIPELLRTGKTAAADAFAQGLAELFPSRCYVELTWHQPVHSVMNLRLAELAERVQLPTVAAGNSKCLRAREHRSLQMLASIRTLTLFDSPAEDKPMPEDGHFYGFLSPAKFHRLYAGFAGAIENTRRIAAQCLIPMLAKI